MAVTLKKKLIFFAVRTAHAGITLESRIEMRLRTLRRRIYEMPLHFLFSTWRGQTDEMKRLGMLEEISPDRRAYMIWKRERVPGMEVVHDRLIPDEDDTVYVIEKGVW